MGDRSSSLLFPNGKKSSACDWVPPVVFIVAAAAVIGLILGAIAFARTQPDIVTITSNGSITGDSVQYLAGTGARAMTLTAAQLATMVGRTFTIVSLTTSQHTVTLSGGAVWTAGGSTTIATFPTNANTGLVFRVISSTSIILLSNSGSVVLS